MDNDMKRIKGIITGLVLVMTYSSCVQKAEDNTQQEKAQQSYQRTFTNQTSPNRF